MKDREELMRTARGFWPARAILTAVETGLFEALRKGRAGAAAVAKRAGTEPRATGLLLDALAGLGVLAKSGAGYSVPTHLRPLLTDGPGSALGMLRHHARLWETWGRLTEAVRRGRPARSRPGFLGGPESARDFTLAMRDGARLLAPRVAEEVDLRGRSLLLDLGGGPGVYAAAFVRRYPDLRALIVDLPDVVAVGRVLLAQEPDVAERIGLFSADLMRDALPKGADAAFLSHVIHSMDEKQVEALFRRVAKALPAGGLFVVRDFFLEGDRVHPPPASLFALNMLVGTDGGRTYTHAETAARLVAAGFTAVRFRRSRAAPDSGYLFARRA